MKTKSKEINTNTTTSAYYDFVLIVFIIAVFGLDFISNLNTLECIEPQFLYLSVLNVLLGCFIYFNPQCVSINLFSFNKSNKIVYAYMIFIVLCCVSLYSSHNVYVSLISFSRLLLVFTLMLNLCGILSGRLYLFNKIVVIVVLATFIQSSQAIIDLITESNSSSIEAALADLKGNTGNINIFSASLCIKIPFVLFGLFYEENWKKWLSYTTLFLASLGIFLTSSRTAFLGLLCQIIIFLIGFYYIRKINFMRMFSLISAIIFAVVISKIIFINSKDTGRNQIAVARLANISEDASANARLTLWKNAFEMSKNYPLTGIGLGNWKVELLKYEKYLFTGNTISTHSHNDILEIVVEAGYLAGIIFVLLLGLIFIVNLNLFIKSKDIQTKSVSGIVLLVFVEYLLDSLFNFPLYRPSMQILFCFGIALTIVNVISSQENNEIAFDSISIVKKISIVLVSLSLFCIYFNHSSFKASQLEYKLVADQSITADEVIKEFPKYPNLGIYGYPFIEYVGIKYYGAKEYSKAIDCFRKANKLNPYCNSDYYISSIHVKLNNIDSAYFYIKKSFSNRPRYQEFFYSILDIAKLKKDTLGILKIHNKFNLHTPSPSNWVSTSKSLQGAGYSLSNCVRFLNKGLQEYPNNSDIMQRKLTILAQSLFDKNQFKLAINNYLKIIKINPNSWITYKNIGICYYNLGQYKEALNYFNKIINAPELDKTNTQELIKVCKNNI